MQLLHSNQILMGQFMPYEFINLGCSRFFFPLSRKGIFLWQNWFNNLNYTSKLEPQWLAQHKVPPAGLQSRLPVFHQSSVKQTHRHGFDPRHMSQHLQISKSVHLTVISRLAMITLPKKFWLVLKQGLICCMWCKKLNKLSRRTCSMRIFTTGKRTKE